MTSARACILEPGDAEAPRTPVHEGADTTPGSRPDRRLRYERYLSSAAWRNSPARLEEIALAGGRCRLCARGAPVVRIARRHSWSRLDVTLHRFGEHLIHGHVFVFGESLEVQFVVRQHGQGNRFDEHLPDAIERYAGMLRPDGRA